MPVTPDQADAVAHAVIRAGKALRGIRRRLPRIAERVDDAVLPILFVVVQEPTRVSGIAESIGSDVSTVSRQVSQLIDAGLATRTSDPHDGRSHLVELTAAGRESVERARARRAEFFQGVLHDWTAEEIEDFVAALDRFRNALADSDLREPTTRQETV